MNYADLKQLIGQDLNRDDLADIIDDYIKGRIEFYQKDFLFCSPGAVSLSTVADSPLLTIPSNLVSIDMIRLLYGGSWRILIEDDYDNLLLLDRQEPPNETIPTRWAPYGKLIRFWPQPDIVYTVELTGPIRIPVPSADTDENFWTQEAATLIRYATTAQIRLLRLRDDQGFQTDMVAAERERLKLVQETTFKESQDAIVPWW